MTDNEVPERIALDWSEGAAVTRGPLFDARTRWIREDVAQAMVAAALDRLIAEAVDAKREACASIVDDFADAGECDDYIAAAIRARKSPPAGED